MGERKFTEHPIRQGAAYPRLLRDLSYLAKEFEKDQWRFILPYIDAIQAYLIEQDVPEELRRPLATLMAALFDVRGGLHSPLFKPNKKKTNRLPYAYATAMGTAALAVTIAPRNMKTNILKRAAKKLMISETKLKNFRTNLLASDDRIKSGAIIPFYVHIINLNKEERESIRDLDRFFAAPWSKKLKPDISRAEDIVRRLRPVPEKYRE